GSWLAGQQINLPAGRAYIKIYGYNGNASWGQTYTLNTGWIWSTTPVPVISGTPHVGQILTAVTGSWSPTPDVVRFQWFRSGSAITGTTTNTYTLLADDYGKNLTVAVTGTKTGYTTVAKTSTATTAVAAAPLDLTAPVPTITGTARAGSTLTAVPGIWGPAPVTLTYQWKANGVTILGATAATYKPVAAQAGKTLTVTVSGTKTGYTTKTKTSTATAID
ncbi:metallophosphoesterase, partial [Arthrobacter oryzae]